MNDLDDIERGGPEEQTQVFAEPIVARPVLMGRALKVLICSIAMLGFAVAFSYDGFVKYPRQNADSISRGETPRHTNWDITLQQILIVPCGLGGLWLLLGVAMRFRGEYRLENGVVHVPGSPPIPLDSITRIDKRKWNVKGLATLSYELADGEKGDFKLDALYYESKPCDAIMDRIEAHARQSGDVVTERSDDDEAVDDDEVTESDTYADDDLDDQK